MPALVAVVGAVAVIFVIYALGPADQPEIAGDLRGAAHVVDGDTLALSGRRIRLAGIDAPELAQSCGPPEARWACGVEARNHLFGLVGDSVACDPEDRDRWGRLVAVCHGEKGDLGAAMVSAGWAVAAGRYVEGELAARVAARGIWAGPFDHPAEWRRQTAGMEEPSPTPSRLQVFLEWLATRLKR